MTNEIFKNIIFKNILTETQEGFNRFKGPDGKFFVHFIKTQPGSEEERRIYQEETNRALGLPERSDRLERATRADRIFYMFEEADKRFGSGENMRQHRANFIHQRTQEFRPRL